MISLCIGKGDGTGHGNGHIESVTSFTRANITCTRLSISGNLCPSLPHRFIIRMNISMHYIGAGLKHATNVDVLPETQCKES
jgi:hypothetical protein